MDVYIDCDSQELLLVLQSAAVTSVTASHSLSETRCTVNSEKFASYIFS